MICKNEFLEFLEFPYEWIELDLYDDELFDVQLKFLLEELEADELSRRMTEGKYGSGSEHWRLGAFVWIIKNKGSKYFDKLKIVAQKERDMGLMKHMLNEMAHSPDQASVARM